MSTLDVSVQTNEEAREDKTQQFIRESANGTLHHTARFLSYHSGEKLQAGRIDIRHIVFRKGGRIVGLIPGALGVDESRTTYSSPWGASIGGLVVAPGTPFSQVDGMVQGWIDLLKEWGADEATVALTPTCFQRAQGQEGIEFAMLRHGFRPVESPMLLATPITREPGFPATVQANDARRRTKKAIEAGCVVESTRDVSRFWPILLATMERNQAEPTHTKEELNRLIECCADEMEIALCLHEGKPVAGMLLMRMNPVSKTTFYICSHNDTQHLNPVNLLVTRALEDASDCEWLDFGPSTFGYSPHPSLIRFKQQNGALPILRRRLVWDRNDKQRSDL